MEKLKVIHMVEDLKIGGAERIIASIAEGLERRRFEISVWCIAKGGEIADELKQKGIDIKILDIFSYHNPINILRLAYLFRKARPDIVHAHGYFGSTFGRLAAILAGVPIIITHVHSTYYEYKKRNMLIERFLSYFTDKIVCVSEAVKDFVVKDEGIANNKTCVIYNGVDVSDTLELFKSVDQERKSFGIEEEDFVVITVASLMPHKGHQVLLDAARIVSKEHSNLRLLIVGDGPLRNELQEYANKLGISSKVVFTGQRQRKDVSRLLNLSDIYVLSSILREGFSISIAEAMAMSKPVIASNLGGIPELIEDKVNGLLVAPGNSYELAAAVEKLVSDRSMREKMGRRGREIYEEKFTVAKMIQNIASLYDGLIKRSLE